MKNRIYLVEDDDKVAQLLAHQLERFGYTVDRTVNFQVIADEVASVQPDLILLDINLPYYDGFYWCRQIRNSTKAPIVFLSARDGTMDQVIALENGGDEYITKPFETDIVIAKIRALLRRTYGEYAESAPSQGLVPNNGQDIYEIHGTVIDLRRAVVENPESSESLTRTELALLRLLLEADGAVVSRDSLLEALWDDTDFVDDNTLTVNVARLRKKLAAFGLESSISTVRGLGYQWMAGKGDPV